MKNKIIIIFLVLIFVGFVIIISFKSQKSETKSANLELKNNKIAEATSLRERFTPQERTQQDNPRFERKMPSRLSRQFTAIKPMENLELSDMDIGIISIIKKSLETGFVLSKAQVNVDPIETIEEAYNYINVNINMACVPRKYLIDNDFFYFSGGTTSDEVVDFSSGIAVNKNDRTITSWNSNP